MKISLALYNNRVTTIFENTCFFRIYNYDPSNHKLTEAGEILLPRNCSYISRISALIIAQVDILICGGICINCKKMFSDYGIKVLDWIHGDTEQVLKAWKEQNLQKHVMPGCTGKLHETKNLGEETEDIKKYKE